MTSKQQTSKKKCFIIYGYNKFTKELLDAKVKEKELLDKSDISNLVQNSNLNTKLATLKKSAGLKVEQVKMVKLQAFDSSYFCGEIHLEMTELRIIQCFSQSLDTLKILAIPVIVQCGNLKDCLRKY